MDPSRAQAMAASLKAALARLWPELRIVASVTHGMAALDQALALRPDVIFLDIRMPLRRLLQQLDPDEFWQVHRAVVVRADAIATAVRNETGKVELSLKGHPARLVASRLYAHLFRAM